MMCIHVNGNVNVKCKIMLVIKTIRLNVQNI